MNDFEKINKLFNDLENLKKWSWREVTECFAHLSGLILAATVLYITSIAIFSSPTSLLAISITSSIPILTPILLSILLLGTAGWVFFHEKTLIQTWIKKRTLIDDKEIEIETAVNDMSDESFKRLIRKIFCASFEYDGVVI